LATAVNGLESGSPPEVGVVSEDVTSKVKYEEEGHVSPDLAVLASGAVCDEEEDQLSPELEVSESESIKEKLHRIGFDWFTRDR
jgi:hypothetical protein